jgi:3-hydroxypropanoate dehydrogenase
MEPKALEEQVAEIFERKKARALDERALRTLFLEARSANRFSPRPIPRKLLERALELAELGPTSFNTVPMRVVFVESHEAKERLRPLLSPGNVDKTFSAPVTAIIAADLQFFEHLPKLRPDRPNARDRFADPESVESTRQFAITNATLQGAYFMLAARALGLDCGPMGGFDHAKTDEAFFPDGRFKSILLCALGYADDEQTRPRDPRLPIDEIARFA